MGFRFRKSFKVAPGVRFNVTGKGASVSGTIPGTGVHWSTRSSGKKSSGAFGTVCYWLLIGWWWWMLRGLFYDLPRLCIRLIKRLVQQYKVWKAKQKYER